MYRAVFLFTPELLLVLWRRQPAADNAPYPVHLDTDEQETLEVFRHLDNWLYYIPDYGADSYL